MIGGLGKNWRSVFRDCWSTKGQHKDSSMKLGWQPEGYGAAFDEMAVVNADDPY
jgi:hypothetical protein